MVKTNFRDVEELFEYLEVNYIELVGKHEFGIKRDSEGNHSYIEIHKPGYINIETPIELKDNGVTLCLNNGKVAVAMWKNIFSMHTTVF